MKEDDEEEEMLWVMPIDKRKVDSFLISDVAYWAGVHCILTESVHSQF